jgi:nucleotidyltransferase/DNA polymerase involved in DNA repair
MSLIKVKTTRRTKEGDVTTWRVLRLKKKETFEQVVQRLRDNQQDYQIIEDTTEEIFVFNGNNYIVTTSTLL